MKLIEEAVIIEIFGIRMYAFGAYVALGALFAMITLGLLCRHFGTKPGTAALTALLSSLCGIVFSRLTFCLLNQELGSMTPLHAWPKISGGGWSMFGLIGGIFLGGLISSRIIKENGGKIADALSPAILAFVIAERTGESRILDFDVSRALDSEWLKNSFLAVGDEEPVLATYYVAAAVALLLFIILLIYIPKREKSGNLAIRFLILFGASCIITESLRYDRFLSITFVGLQQIAAAVMLAIGVVLAIRRSNRPKSALAICAIISLILMVGIVIGLEFALDRTTWNKIMIYAAMVAAVSLPAALGFRLLKSCKKEPLQ